MSILSADAPRQFNPPIAQRHLEAEVANCVGGVLSPVLANVALSVLDEHFVRAPGGPATTTYERTKRRRHGLPNCRLVRYADDWCLVVSGYRDARGSLS
jgi:hypothetical protein